MKRLSLLALLVLGLHGMCLAQPAQLHRTVSLQYTQATLEEVLLDVARRYSLSFSYSKDLIPVNRRVTLVVQDQPLEEALKRLFEGTGIVFREIGEQLVLKKEEAAPAPRSSSLLLIQGRVTDGVTGAFLPFASISISGSALGSVTNGNGDFVLRIPESMKTDTLRFSYLGYESYAFPLAGWASCQTLAIALTPQPQQLQAVEVRGKTALSLVQDALARISDNYPIAPFRQTFYLRDHTWQDGEPILATESIYQAYRGGITDKGVQKQVKLVQGRIARYDQKYADILKAFPVLNGFDLGLTAYNIFTDDLARYLVEYHFLGKNGLQNHLFEWGENTHYDGREVYVINFDQKDKNKALFKGTFYIDVNSLAFIHMSVHCSPKGIAYAPIFGPKVLEKILGLGENKLIRWENEVHYRELNGKWYIAHRTLKQEVALLKTKRHFNAIVSSESNLVVTDIQPDSAQPFPAEDVATARNLAYRQYGAFDPDWWATQNVIKADTAFDESFRRIEAHNKPGARRLDERIHARLNRRKNRNSESGGRQVEAAPYEVAVNQSADWTDSELTQLKETPHFRLFYHESDSAVIDSVVQRLEGNYHRVLGWFGVRRLPLIEVRMYPSLAAYHGAIQQPNAPDWMVGSASINKFSLVSPLNPGPAHSYTSVMQGMVHEFAHCVHIHLLRNNLGKARNNDARWLWEGVACYVAGQTADLGQLAYLQHEEYPSLDDLNDSANGEKVYQLGYWLIDYLQQTWGRKAVLKLIRTNADVPSALGVSVAKLEQGWHAYLRRKRTDTADSTTQK